MWKHNILDQFNFSFSNLFCITHSTNRLKAFDTIYIFNNGSIEDSGTYEDLKKRIVFALEYFLEELDEIPDSSPLIGLLDDYVLVRWVVDSLMADYSELFEA